LESEREGVKSVSVEENKRLAREAIKIWTTGDLDAADALYAPDYVNRQHHDPEDPRDLHGVQAMKNFAQEFRQASPDIQTTMEDQVAEGDKVVTRFSSRGTHQGESEDFGPPTGNRIEVTGITIEQFSEEGKIVEDWTNFDALGLMQQLGLVPEQQ
jgi:steroid delta-isomerase-like uncharacterized protein